MTDRWVLRPGEEIVYGLVGGEEARAYGVFVPRRVGEQLIGVEESRTWGELRRRAGEDLYREALEGVGIEEEDPLPADDQPFDVTEVAGHEDGDWPDWAAQRMPGWLPADVPAYWYGGGDTALNGEWVGIRRERVEDLAALLRDRGHPCTRDDAWIGAVEQGR